MQYFKNPENLEVYAYDESQQELISYAIKNKWEEVTGNWPPPPDLISICRNNAKFKIEQVDWSVLPDVNLSNKNEFVVYRAALRNLILNPVADPVWPTEPTPIWS